MKLIKNTTVYTMNSDNDIIDNCDVLINNEKIIEVGINLPVTSNVKVVDASGFILTPGLIDIHTHVGIFNEGERGGSDGNENVNPFTPSLSAIDAINPEHFSFKDARSGGVTTVQTGAGSSNPVGGVWTIIKTSGNIVENMILRERSGLKSATGENAKNRYGQIQKKSPNTRMSIANYIRGGFKKAKQLMEQGHDTLEKLYKKESAEYYPFVEVLQGKMPWRVHAHRSDDIVTAIRIAKEFNIELSIEHATEGYKIVSYIKKSGFPVTVGPFMVKAGKNETRNLSLDNARILSDAGILVAINTDHPVTPIQYLSIAAAEAVKHGMNETAALRAITINPAIIGGIENRVGSIERNKDADLVLWSAHPFCTKARVLRTMINGEFVYENNI